jgi:hypothetical protein
MATAWEVGFPSCGLVSNFPNRGKQEAAESIVRSSKLSCDSCKIPINSNGTFISREEREVP